MARLAMALSAVAFGVAVFALARRPPEPPRAQARDDRGLARLAEVEELRLRVEALEARRPAPPDGPTPASPEPKPEGGVVAEGGDHIQAIVDDAVARQTEKVIDKLRVKADKKPAMDVFASTLGLTEQQREVTVRVVVEGQREVHAILTTPTADGTNLMDQLVEVAAKSLAEPGKDPGWGAWLARVLTDRIPGTDETYGARIETVKKGMRATFQREWTEEQYKEFEEWGVDPTEIENVPGGPNEALMTRIAERARQLGAPIAKD